MTNPSYDHDFWESLWSKTLREQADKVASRPANVHLGGTLFLVGHRPIDPATGAPTAAAGRTQVSVEAAVAVLQPREWTVVVAEERPRTSGAGVDAVICARRIS